jgi:hypothetical protein
LDSDLFAALLSRIPGRFAPSLGPCIFIQPADASGALWVLNLLTEGTGRYGSRFTAAMDDRTRVRYVSYFSARASDDWGCPLLDLRSPDVDNLNVHAAQTPFVLAMPGDVGEPSPQVRRLGLRDLMINRGEKRGLPFVTDLSGNELLPVHLGGASWEFLSTPLKILSMFGLGDVRLTSRPQSQNLRGEEVLIRERLTIGNLVVARRRWALATNSLVLSLGSISGAESFSVIDQWRREHGLPDQVVLIEKVFRERKTVLHKPQYLDFTSPLFSSVFRQSLRENADTLIVEEMLPHPISAVCDQHGDGWVLELMLDALALRPPGEEKRKRYSGDHAAGFGATVRELDQPEPVVAQ